MELLTERGTGEILEGEDSILFVDYMHLSNLAELYTSKLYLKVYVYL